MFINGCLLCGGRSLPRLSPAFTSRSTCCSPRFTSVEPNSIAGTTGGRWFFDCFFFSVQTLATVGYGHMYPQTLYGHVVSMIEIMSGIFLLAVVDRIHFCPLLASGGAHRL